MTTDADRLFAGFESDWQWHEWTEVTRATRAKPWLVLVTV